MAQAAIREAREETGLEVELTRLVGVYSLPISAAGSGHSIVFCAHAVGGSLAPNPIEVLEARFFCADELPTDLLWWHRRRILDALSGAVAVAYVQQPEGPAGVRHGATREEIYAMRDRGELNMREVYRWACIQPEASSESREL